MTNLRRAINSSINEKNKVHDFRFKDTTQTYRVVKMMARHWNCDVKTAYQRYANFIYT